MVAHGGLCFSISNLPPALRTQAIRQLQRGFSCGPRVAFSNFPLSVTVCTALCVRVFLSVAGHGRVCNGALTTAKLLPSFLAFLLVSLVRSLFSAFNILLYLNGFVSIQRDFNFMRLRDERETTEQRITEVTQNAAHFSISCRTSIYSVNILCLPFLTVIKRK